MRYALFGLTLAVLLLATACPRIQEPWVPADNSRNQERARSPEARQTLRHRLTWVQTDR